MKLVLDLNTEAAMRGEVEEYLGGRPAGVSSFGDLVDVLAQSHKVKNAYAKKDFHKDPSGIDARFEITGVLNAIMQGAKAKRVVKSWDDLKKELSLDGDVDFAEPSVEKEEEEAGWLLVKEQA
ncbi:expressed unknown protein [Seminavis robusta]|uniref:Uncharacterized protein n=1 Tax=Seminavis robusta TaxID=568900 RepID=A0A9N8HDI7_9STRA|nr:expressed unknown protein [Seminavis robusta]|eukprot:Sro362_g126780.1 n/a (123) ;mRNA; r:43963-44331